MLGICEKVTFMIRRRTSLALLIYWGLLINLGPSLHTHTVFGLHGQGCCQPLSSVAQLDLRGDCDCGCDQKPETNAVEVEQHVVAYSSCSFCKFFKQYQADSELPESFEPLEKIDGIIFRSELSFATRIFQTRARGPPSCDHNIQA